MIVVVVVLVMVVVSVVGVVGGDERQIVYLYCRTSGHRAT